MNGSLDWEPCAEELDDGDTEDGGQHLVRQEESFSVDSHYQPIGVRTNSEGADISISISTIFFPENKDVGVEPDGVVLSCDGFVFYLNSHLLSTAGAATFPSTPLQQAWLTTPNQVAQVPETAAILTVILCAVYGIASNIIAPNTDDICAAIDCMPVYGLDPTNLVRRGTQLHSLLMTHHTPFRPLFVFSTAACHDIEFLAQDASSHLLSLELTDIDDHSAVKMGASYLRRLILLNVNRVAELKRIVGVKSPGNHPLHRRTRGCSHTIQTAMNSEWVFAMKKLFCGAKSDMSPSVVREICRRAAEELPCKECKELWYGCSDNIATQWAQIKFTI